MYQKVLVPTDGSACSEEATRHALALAKEIAAEVTFLYVMEPLPSAITSYGYAAYSEQILGNLKREAERLLNEALQLAKEAGVKAEMKIVQWVRPSDAIIAAMAECDLVVMGSHGRSGVRRLLLGSVTEGVMRQSTKPVLIIHLPQQPEGFLEASPKEAMSRDNLRDAFNAR